MTNEPDTTEKTMRSMTIVNEKPPIYEKAHLAFEIDDSETVYTYGDKLYNPAGLHIGQDLLEHESTHMLQQRELGENGPAIWWEQYIADKVFRQEQEIEAYGRQYAYYRTKTKDRNTCAKYLSQLAMFLSSKLYKLDITYPEALKAIREESDANLTSKRQ